MSNTLDWPEVAARLAPARTYWLVTASATGDPHAAPVWGVVLGEDLHLYSERRTVKARHLAVNPRVVVHLESGEDVVIVHGEAEDLGAPGGSPDVVEALRAKYHDPADAAYLPDADPSFDVLYRIRPHRALTWRLDDYDASQRRWHRA